MGYRDIGDQGKDHDHMDIIDFTDDHQKVKIKI